MKIFLTNISLRFWIGILGSFVLQSTAKAVVLHQIDDFESGTTANWEGRFPSNNSSGGPAGLNDNFLGVSSSGTGGPGSNMTIYNRVQWTGDYLSAGVTAVSMDLINFGPTALSMRIGFKQLVGNDSSPGFLSSVPFSLANDGQWHSVTFGIVESAMTRINSGTLTFATLLAGPAEMRIFHSVNGTSYGESVNGALGVDNIHAVPEPQTLFLLALGGLLGLARFYAGAKTCKGVGDN